MDESNNGGVSRPKRARKPVQRYEPEVTSLEDDQSVDPNWEEGSSCPEDDDDEEEDGSYDSSFVDEDDEEPEQEDVMDEEEEEDVDDEETSESTSANDDEDSHMSVDDARQAAVEAFKSFLDHPSSYFPTPPSPRKKRLLCDAFLDLHDQNPDIALLSDQSQILVAGVTAHIIKRKSLNETDKSVYKMFKDSI